MKILTKFILLTFIASLFLFPFIPAQAAIDGHLRVVSPNGGETFTEGDVTTIRWDASGNIDKIMLGYSSGPGNLNWIATSIPNTGSYTWKVNVGNTTKTSFVIDITGYETGKGSLSDKSDGWFTVYQENEFPPEPTPTSIKTSTPEQIKTPSSTPTPTPTPTPNPTAQPTGSIEKNNDTTINIQETTIVSITQIELNQNYYFEGSKTTDLSKVDPANVNNFTLDSLDLMYFTFLGNADLSDQEAVDTFEDLDDQVYLDYYFFWFSWEFWILFETDVQATFYDTTNNLNADAPVTVNDQVLDKDEYQIALTDTGEKKVTISPEVINKYVKEGEKIEIAMQPSLEVNLQPDQKISVDNNQYELTGSISDSTGQVIVNFNGEKIELFIEEDGSFTKTLNLEQGNNAVKVLAYNKDEEKPFSEIDSIIEYQPEQKNSLFNYTIIALILIVIFGASVGYWFLKNKKA